MGGSNSVRDNIRKAEDITHNPIILANAFSTYDTCTNVLQAWRNFVNIYKTQWINIVTNSCNNTIEENEDSKRYASGHNVFKLQSIKAGVFNLINSLQEFVIDNNTVYMKGKWNFMKTSIFKDFVPCGNDPKIYETFCNCVCGTTFIIAVLWEVGYLLDINLMSQVLAPGHTFVRILPDTELYISSLGGAKYPIRYYLETTLLAKCTDKKYFRADLGNRRNETVIRKYTQALAYESEISGSELLNAYYLIVHADPDKKYNTSTPHNEESQAFIDIIVNPRIALLCENGMHNWKYSLFGYSNFEFILSQFPILFNNTPRDKMIDMITLSPPFINHLNYYLRSKPSSNGITNVHLLVENLINYVQTCIFLQSKTFYYAMYVTLHVCCTYFNNFTPINIFLQNINNFLKGSLPVIMGLDPSVFGINTSIFDTDHFPNKIILDPYFDGLKDANQHIIRRSIHSFTISSIFTNSFPSCNIIPIKISIYNPKEEEETESESEEPPIKKRAGKSKIHGVPDKKKKFIRVRKDKNYTAGSTSCLSTSCLSTSCLSTSCLSTSCLSTSFISSSLDLFNI
jgi:hypothetical protein